MFFNKESSLATAVDQINASRWQQINHHTLISQGDRVERVIVDLIRETGIN